MTLAERFYELYAGLPRAHGKYTPGQVGGTKNKMGGQASTVHELLTFQKWQDHLDGKQGLGVVPIMDDAHVWWGAIDVDVYPLDIPALEKKIEQFGLPLVCVRTKSGGCHATIFCAQPVRASIMRGKLQEFAVVLGHPGVEIFPKQVALASDKDVGNWLNMPYFDCDRTTRYGILQGKALEAEAFLEYAYAMRVTDEEALAGIVPVGAGHDDFSDGPPCLQALAARGLPEGTRNVSLFAMGVYARLKHGEAWQEHLDQYNHDFLEPPLGTREIQTLIKSLGRKDYYYQCKTEPLCSLCSKEVCKTRKYGVGDGLDDEVSLSIGRLAKLDTTPPTWIIDVDGVRMELETEDLMVQDRFRKLCVAKISKLPRKVKPMVWETFLRQRLEDVEVIPAPEDASNDGQLWDLVETFCTTTPARTREEVVAGKPWTENGKTYFQISSLTKYMEAQKFVMVRKQVFAVLHRHGGKQEQLWVKSKNIKLWSIPEFKDQQQPDDFSVPRVEDNSQF